MSVCICMLDRRAESGSSQLAIHTTYLSAGTLFMIGREIYSENAQVNTINLCAFYCRSETFRPVQHFVVSDMYHCALRALAEKKKFLTYID